MNLAPAPVEQPLAVGPGPYTPRALPTRVYLLLTHEAHVDYEPNTSEVTLEFMKWNLADKAQDTSFDHWPLMPLLQEGGPASSLRAELGQAS